LQAVPDAAAGLPRVRLLEPEPPRFIRRHDREPFDALPIEADVDADRADRAAVADAESGRDHDVAQVHGGAHPVLGAELPDLSEIDERGPPPVIAGDREAELEAAFEKQVAADGTHVEGPAVECPRVAGARGDVGGGANAV